MAIHGRVVVASVLLGLLACSNPVAPVRDMAAPVQTNATSYVLVKQGFVWRTEIPITWRNPGVDTLYVVNCGGATGISLQKQNGSEWVGFWSPAIPACLSGPIRIPPGSTFTDTVQVWGAEPGHNTMPEFPTKEVDGVFRLVWTDVVFHYTDRGPSFGEPVPIESRYSNSFRLSQGQ